MADYCWGPKDRSTFTMKERSPYVTFNSIVDNQDIGDERTNFVVIRKKGELKFAKEIAVKPGDEFTVRIYYHNNADPSLNSKGMGISYDTTYSLISGSDYRDGNEIQGFLGEIRSSNSNPGWVQDYCHVIINAKKYTYIATTARIHNQSGTHPIKRGTGYQIPIGINKMDGIIPAGLEYSGYIEVDYEVKPI